MSKQLPNRPAPNEISFEASCFKTIGIEEYYTVSRSALYSGPATFYNRAEAEAFAKKTNRTVSVQTREIKERIRWK